MSEFSDRLDELERGIGKRKLTVRCEVNQVYAHYQEAHPEFHHPDGGKAFYLRDTLYRKSADMVRKLASGVCNGEFHERAKSCSEDLSEGVYIDAPWEFGDLRASGHPRVDVDDATIYDRRPNVERLGDAELKDKAHLRYLFDPHRYRSDR